MRHLFLSSLAVLLAIAVAALAGAQMTDPVMSGTDTANTEPPVKLVIDFVALHEASELEQAGDIEGALARLKAAESAAPEDGTLVAAQGAILLARGDREAAKADLDAVAAFVAAYLRGLAEQPGTRDWIEALVRDEVEGVTLAAYLERRGLLEPWSDWARTTIADRTRALAGTEEFATWFHDLLD